MRFACRSAATLTALSTVAALLHPGASWAQQATQTGGAGADLGQYSAQTVQPSTGLQSWQPFPTTNALPPPALQTPGEAPPEPPPPFLAKLGIGARQGWTDNVYLTSSNTKSDEISTINPTVNLSAISRDVSFGLNYDGAYDRYFSNTNLDGFRHNGIGMLTTQLVDKQLFFDARGTVSEQNLNPYGPITAGGRTEPTNRVRVFSYEAGPRLQEQLGDWAIAQLTATHDQTINETFAPVTDVPGAQSTAVASPGNTRADHGRLEVRSGQGFSQVLWDYSTDYRHSSMNSEALDQLTHQLAAEYRLNNTWGLLATVGDDYIHGDQVSTSNGGFFYNGGIHWTPSAATDLRAGAGRRYGETTYFGLLDHKFGPMTSLRVSHNVGITTDALNVFDALSTVQRDGQGNFINPFSGLAANPAVPLFQLSNAVYRQDVTTAALTHTDGRNTITLTATEAKQTILSGPQSRASTVTGTPLGTNSTVANASLSWTHQLSPNLSSTATVGGSDVLETSGGAAKTKNMTASLKMDYLLNPTLTAELSYAFANTWQPATPSSGLSAQTGSIRDNLVYVSLRKQF